MRIEDNVKNLEDLGINISDMVTKTELHYHNLDIPFIEPREILPIGLDVGYSSTKVYSFYGHHKFSSLLVPIKEKEISDITFRKDTLILYRDKDITNKTWMVGDIIYESQSKITDEELFFSKDRAESDENIILNRIGIALAMMKKNSTFSKNPEILLTAGLPETYDDLTNKYIDQLSGYHEFEIQLGRNKKWIPISFVIKEENIDILSQPFGTLLSITVNRQGKIINRELLESNRSLIFDAGYGTVDTFVLQGGRIGDCITWEDKAMKSIHKELLAKFEAHTGGTEKIALHELNYYLSLPESKRFIKTETGESWYFDDKLNSLTAKMADENIRALEVKYKKFKNVDIIIMTGGTSKIYYPYFIVGIPNIEIKIAEVKNDENPDESFNSVYANSVGFFNYTLMKYRSQINYKEPVENAENEAAITMNHKKDK